MSLSAQRESLAGIHGRDQRAGRPHRSRNLDEFCANCSDHRQAALRLLNTALRTTPPKRSGPKRSYEPAEVLPVLKAIWLASDQPCNRLLQAALPQWLSHHEGRTAPLPEAFKEKLLQISPAQIDRLLRPARVQHPKRGLSTTRPGTLALRQAVPTRGGSPDTIYAVAGEFVVRWADRKRTLSRAFANVGQASEFARFLARRQYWSRVAKDLAVPALAPVRSFPVGPSTSTRMAWEIASSGPTFATGPRPRPSATWLRR